MGNEKSKVYARQLLKLILRMFIVLLTLLLYIVISILLPYLWVLYPKFSIHSDE